MASITVRVVPDTEIVEPVPARRGPGRIIFLNGASSSGKSTLAVTLQEALDEPFLHVASDRLVDAGMLPGRREDHGPFDWWREMRPRFFAGFHASLPAFAWAGNDLIVEQHHRVRRVAERPRPPPRRPRRVPDRRPLRARRA